MAVYWVKIIALSSDSKTNAFTQLFRWAMDENGRGGDSEPDAFVCSKAKALTYLQFGGHGRALTAGEWNRSRYDRLLADPLNDGYFIGTAEGSRIPRGVQIKPVGAPSRPANTRPAVRFLVTDEPNRRKRTGKLYSSRCYFHHHLQAGWIERCDPVLLNASDCKVCFSDLFDFVRRRCRCRLGRRCHRRRRD